MTQTALRYRLVSRLLQSPGPVRVEDLADAADGDGDAVRAALDGLVGEGRVVSGNLVEGQPGPQYCWAANWARESGRRAVRSKRTLEQIVNLARDATEHDLDIEGSHIIAFHDYVVNAYEPPQDKRFLVFFQCAVRRPFSKAPSQASMRRAVSVATGFDPAKDFERCPVHVVVLASNIGPVPYELEDVYPANVGGGGVKHFGDEHYARVRPILARRMADYITAFGDRYTRKASFTDGRYGDVIAEAQRLTGARFPIFPDRNGPKVARLGKSAPRTYWQKHWIQLYLEIVSWLDAPARREAQARLKKLGVVYG